MKKIFSRFFTLATMAVAGATFVACGSDDDVAKPGSKTDDGKTPSTTVTSYNVNLTVGSPTTSNRALSLDGNYLSSPWATSDNIYVYDNSWNLFGGKLNPTSTGTKQDVDGKPAYVATIQGTISSATTKLEVGSKVNMVYPRTTWSYEGQDGTLETIAKNYAYAIATNVEVTEMSGNNITGANPDPIRFVNQQAIVKFVFQDNTGAAQNLSKIEIKSTNGTDLDLVTSVSSFNSGTESKGILTVTSSTAMSEWFVALRGVKSGSTLSVVGTTSDSKQLYFSGTLTDDLENGKYYILTFKNKKIEDDALTVEAIEDDTYVDLIFGAAAKPVTCKILNADNTLADVITIAAAGAGGYTLKAGQKMLFYGENDKYTTYSSEYNYEYEYDDDGNIIGISQTAGPQVGNCNIRPSKLSYLYNNIMSLTDGEEWKAKNTKKLRAPGTFAGLFKDALVKEHESNVLVLPATTLQSGCYQQLLMNTQFADVPDDLLPATTLQSYCYSHMFYNTRITESPVLPAVTLANGCYNYMFSSCENLNKITCYAKTLPIDEVGGQFNTCSANWVQGVSNTGTFVMNSSFTALDVEVANYFATHPTETTYTTGGTTYNKSEYMVNNDHVCWSIGTGGIHENWTVTKPQ